MTIGHETPARHECSTNSQRSLLHLLFDVSPIQREASECALIVVRGHKVITPRVQLTVRRTAHEVGPAPRRTLDYVTPKCITSLAQGQRVWKRLNSVNKGIASDPTALNGGHCVMAFSSRNVGAELRSRQRSSQSPARFSPERVRNANRQDSLPYRCLQESLSLDPLLPSSKPCSPCVCPGPRSQHRTIVQGW